MVSFATSYSGDKDWQNENGNWSRNEVTFLKNNAKLWICKRKYLTDSELQKPPSALLPFSTTVPAALPCLSNTKDNHITFPTKPMNAYEGVTGVGIKTGSACTRRETAPTHTHCHH
jgi:hypothetical protein